MNDDPVASAEPSNPAEDLVEDLGPGSIPAAPPAGRLLPEASWPEGASAIERLDHLFADATRFFDSGPLAGVFMWSPNPALGNVAPTMLARTDEGAREVEAVIGRIEHGVFG